MKNLNELYTSGQSVEISQSETYTLKDNEVYINGLILKKEDLEVTFNGICKDMNEEEVEVGVRIRLGNLTQPANFLPYKYWLIDGVKPTSLSDLVESIKTALYHNSDNSNASIDISSIEEILQGLKRTRASSQKVYNLNQTNNTLTLNSKSITQIDVICVGFGSTCNIDVSPTGSNPINVISLDYNELYKYERDYKNYEEGVNPNDLTITFNGTGGYVIVEIAEV